jgi:hypothetical protein
MTTKVVIYTRVSTLDPRKSVDRTSGLLFSNGMGSREGIRGRGFEWNTVTGETSCTQLFDQRCISEEVRCSRLLGYLTSG